MNTKKPRIVIIGAGFGGLNVAKGLGNCPGLEVIVIDSRNHHLFQPLLYQVATAELSPADIAIPIRSVVGKYDNCKVVLGTVNRVDRKNRKLTLQSSQVIEYDRLVVACGSNHSYFGHSEWEEHAPGLKTLEQATEIRRRILLAFERAESETDKVVQQRWQTFVIVGGGPAGVELAGAVSEVSRNMVTRDFKNIKGDSTKVILIEGGPRILAAFPESLARAAAANLKDLGVEILASTIVNGITSDGVSFADSGIAAKTVIWSAGVEPSPLAKSLGTPLDRSGRVIVDAQLNLPNDPEVFVIGDMAHAENNGTPLPGLAPVAIQQGRYVAKSIRHPKSQKPFRYVDKGIMAAIGKKKAILKIKHFEMHGFFAWLAWIFVHLFFLIGFRNRFVVIFEWGWEFLTFRRGSRLILTKEWRGKSPTN